jgi:hypothetical protein
MNSYNDNLRSTVVNSLQSQYLNQKKLKSQMTAAMFTLYHAEGAAITADEKLDKAQSTLILKRDVKAQAVKNSNIAVNLLASANQADQYFKQSVNNTAVCAANVQVSAKSIVRLSGDIANIAGITGATDLDTDIDGLADNIRFLMNETAKIAELASQFAMESSSLTAEVSSATVLSKAKSTNSLMNNLLQVVSSNYDTASQTVAADNVTLALASGAEKLAEGALEDVSVDYQASRNAYESVNQKLNINLRVPHARMTNIGFTVYFDAIVSAFGFATPEHNLQANDVLSTQPVQDYYVVVVKESKQLTFTVSEAENLQMNIGRYAKRITKIRRAGHLHLKHEFAYGEIQDSDGDAITLGAGYCVFVLAIYKDAYKHALNCFDNFLSASSKSFTLTIKLNAAVIPGKTNPIITAPDQLQDIVNFQNHQLSSTDNSLAIDTVLPDYWQMLDFYAANSIENQPEYRCMFLPMDKGQVDGFLTQDLLNNLVQEQLPLLEDIFADIDAKLADLEKAEADDEVKLGKVTDKLRKEILAILTEALSPALFRQIEQILKDLLTDYKERQDIYQLSNQIKTLIAAQTNFMHLLEQSEDGQGLFFNVALAEQVTAANYSVAVEPIVLEDVKKGEVEQLRYLVFIGPETTDNFGNPLVEGNRYMPVILTVSKKAIDQPENYTSAIATLPSGNYFIYSKTNNNN